MVEVTYYCSFPGNPGNFTNIYNIKYFNRTEWTRSPRRNKIVSFFALLLPYLLHSLLVTQNCLLPFSHGGWHTYRGILLECKIGPLQAGIKSSLRLSDIYMFNYCLDSGRKNCLSPLPLIWVCLFIQMKSYTRPMEASYDMNINQMSMRGYPISNCDQATGTPDDTRNY